jgi:hypothetical protein
MGAVLGAVIGAVIGCVASAAPLGCAAAGEQVASITPSVPAPS